MKNLKSYFWLTIAILALVSCKQQQARMPVSRSSGEFLNASVERNKNLLKVKKAK